MSLLILVVQFRHIPIYEMSVSVGFYIQLVGAFRDSDRRRFLNCFGMGSVYLDRPVIVNRLGVVMLDGGSHVVLGVDGDHFLALRVVDGNLVIASTAFSAVALYAAYDAAIGQLIRGRLLCVVDAASDDRLIGVAL